MSPRNQIDELESYVKMAKECVLFQLPPYSTFADNVLLYISHIRTEIEEKANEKSTK
jgi:hypothetical protein